MTFSQFPNGVDFMEVAFLSFNGGSYFLEGCFLESLGAGLFEVVRGTF